MNDKTINQGILYAKNGDTSALKLWLEAGNNPNEYDHEGWTPLLWAAARGHSEAVKLLIEQGADSQKGHAKSEALPIHLAGHSGDVETAKILLEHNVGLLQHILYEITGAPELRETFRRATEDFLRAHSACISSILLYNSKISTF